jgi:hypothetical protein
MEEAPFAVRVSWVWEKGNIYSFLIDKTDRQWPVRNRVIML